MRLLDLLIRRNRGELTPRLNELDKERVREELSFQPGGVEQIDLQRVEDIPVRSASIIDEIFGPEPEIKAGAAETGDEVGWYEINFQDNFTREPRVTATAIHRDGEFSSKSYESPSHGAPSISFNSNRISFANVFEENFKEASRDTGDRMFENGEDAFESFLPTVATVDLSDPFVDAWDFLMTNTWGEGRREADGDGAVESIYGFLGEFIGSQIDEAINEKADEIEQAVGTDVPNAVDEHNSAIQDSYGSLTSQAQNSLNESPKLLWDSIGMPEGAMVTPVNVRNVSKSSFEVLGMEGGMTVEWIGIAPTP